MHGATSALGYLVSKHGSWYAVTNGIDVGHAGLEPFIHFQPTAAVLLGGFAGNLVQIQALQVRPPPCHKPSILYKQY